MKIGFVSLGCSKNTVDTEVMLARLVAAGYEITPEDIEAEIIVVNTCGFIESAKQESIDNILDVAWLKEHGKCKAIIATGCLVERYGNEFFEQLPEVDAILGCGSYDEIVNAVRAVEMGEKYSSMKDKNTATLGGDRVLTTPDYTAYLKVGEGCDNKCTYCAIPLIRGEFRSRKIEELVSEAKELEQLGVKELNIIAQDTSRYGLDLYGKYMLPELVRQICAATEIPWIRLLYLYPDKITDELVEEFRNNDRLLKYADIPVQHISDGVLEKMNRHGDSATIKDAIKKLRSVDGMTLRTTAIVGFPGESREDFDMLCRFIREEKFERFGAFTYSAEEGTAAAEFDGQIDEQEKQDRYDILMREQLSVSEEYLKKQIGKTVVVLCEGYDAAAGTHFGRSAADAPDIDGKIYFSAREKIPAGEFVNVKITEALDYDLIGEAY